jgi:hypothetical protein
MPGGGREEIDLQPGHDRTNPVAQGGDGLEGRALLDDRCRGGNAESRERRLHLCDGPDVGHAEAEAIAALVHVAEDDAGYGEHAGSGVAVPAIELSVLELPLEYPKTRGRKSSACEECSQGSFRCRALGWVGQVHRRRPGAVDEVSAKTGDDPGYCDLTGIGILSCLLQPDAGCGSIGSGGIRSGGARPVAARDYREPTGQEQRREREAPPSLTGQTESTSPPSHLNLRIDRRL